MQQSKCQKVVYNDGNILLLYEDDVIILKGEKVDYNAEWLVYSQGTTINSFDINKRQKGSSFDTKIELSGFYDKFQILEDNSIVVLYNNQLLRHNIQGEVIERLELPTEYSWLKCQNMNIFCTPRSGSDLEMFSVQPLKKINKVFCYHIDHLNFLEHEETTFFSVGLDVFYYTTSHPQKIIFLETAEGLVDKIQCYDNKIWVQNSARGDYWLCPLIYVDLKNHKTTQVTDKDASFSVHQNVLFIWVNSFGSENKDTEDWIGVYQMNGEIHNIWEYPKNINIQEVFCIGDHHYGVLCTKNQIHIIDSNKNHIRSVSFQEWDSISIEATKYIVWNDTLIESHPLHSLL